MDADHYPTDEELETIKKWPHTDIRNLMDYIRKNCWEHGDWGWQSDKYSTTNDYITYNVSTGGWSGNESVIEALQDNFMFWSLCWWKSERGGHYEFRIGKEIQ